MAIYGFSAPGTSPGGRTFSDPDPAGYAGVLYGPSGTVIDASGVTVSVDAGAPDVAILSGLPDGAAYAFTYVVRGTVLVEHYSEEPSAYPYRVIPYREPAAAGDLTVDLMTDGAVSASVVVLTETAGGYVARGWDVEEVGAHQLVVSTPRTTIKPWGWKAQAVVVPTAPSGPGWDAYACDSVAFFAEGTTVTVSRATTTGLVLDPVEVPAIFPAMSFAESSSLPGGTIKVGICPASLGTMPLDGASVIRLTDGPQYGFEPLDGIGAVSPSSVPSGAMAYVEGYLVAEGGVS